MQTNRLGHDWRYDAVIFDWFGTLTQTWAGAKVEQMTDAMAACLGLPPDAFRQAWYATNTARDLGVFAHCTATLSHCCAALGVVARPQQIAHARAIRFAALREALTLRDDAIETLHRLRRHGLRIGLISDASWDDVTLWPTTPLAELVDAAVVSCREGVKKPDPRLYHRAGERLAVCLTRCLYVGDGGSNELAGAVGVGMEALLIEPSHVIPGGAYRPGGVPWPGPRITRLSELSSLVTRGSI
jgi:putative hydrolase of the HAD superfamily